MGRILSPEQVDALRAAGRINALVHERVKSAIRPGVTGEDLEEIAREVMQVHGAVPSFPTWTEFPAAICVSVNEQVGHGLPSATPMREGDIVSIDVGVCYDGMHSDAAATYPVGNVKASGQRLLSVTKAALEEGILAARPGEHVSNISSAVMRVVQAAGYDTVRHAFGHGIGAALHEDPQIANFGPAQRGPRLREGMAIAVEPVVAAGLRYTRKLPDGWTTVTIDGALSAHFEHTVLITSQGAEILTALPSEDGQCGGCLAVSKSQRIIHNPRLGDLTLRPLQPSDRDMILNLAHVTMDAILMEAWGRRARAEELFGDPSAETLVCTCEDGTLAGFLIYVERGALHVNTLAVAPDYQRTGIGRQLMQVAEAIAKEKGLDAVELWVQENNAKAIPFYQTLGFEIVGRPYFKTLLMHKSL